MKGFHIPVGHRKIAPLILNFCATIVMLLLILLCLVVLVNRRVFTKDAVSFSQSPVVSEGAPLRVLVVTGGHDHEVSFYSLFEGQSDVKAVVNPHPDSFNKNLVRDFDVIALYDMVSEVPERQRDNLVKYLEAGKGLFVIHHALVDYPGWRWWWHDVVGCRYNEKPDGVVQASTYLHDVDMTITPVGKHPITGGVAPFQLNDETYGRMQFADNVKILAKTDAASSDGPVLWIGPYPKARVVALQLGHGGKAHQNPAFRNLFRRCLLWAGGKL
jgi:type 1 glutamine amidotransferase